MPRPIKNNRRFINIYEIVNYNTTNNIINCIGTHEALTYNEATVALVIIKSTKKFEDPKYSLQIQDFDAWKFHHA